MGRHGSLIGVVRTNGASQRRVRSDGADHHRSLPSRVGASNPAAGSMPPAQAGLPPIAPLDVPTQAELRPIAGPMPLRTQTSHPIAPPDAPAQADLPPIAPPDAPAQAEPPPIPDAEKGPHHGGGPLFWVFVRRRPTLPHRPRCSTIGAGGLSFRVRNGSGRFPAAMAAVTLWNFRLSASDTRHRCWWVWSGFSVVRELHSGRGCVCGQVLGLLVPVG